MQESGIREELSDSGYKEGLPIKQNWIGPRIPSWSTILWPNFPPPHREPSSASWALLLPTRSQLG